MTRHRAPKLTAAEHEASAREYAERLESFRGILRDTAFRYLSNSVARRVSPSDVASSTIRTALRKFMSGEHVPIDDQLRLWLRGICVNKAQSAARRETRQKRDVRRTHSLQEGAAHSGHTDDSADRMVAEAVGIVRTYIESLVVPLDRDILTLSILLPLMDGKPHGSAREIRELLLTAHDDVRSIRAIQKRLAKHRKVLESLLFKEDESP